MGFFDWFKKSNSVNPENEENSNNKLEAILKKAAVELAYRPEFYKLLLSEELVVLTGKTSLKEGSYTLEESTTVNIATLSDGRIPVFTSTDRIFDKNVITQQVPFMGMKGADLFQLAKGATFILNSYSDYGKELPPQEIESMLDGTVLSGKHRQITVEKETQVLLGQPVVYPQKVVDSLKTLFLGKPAVKAAYLGWIHDPASSDPPHLIIGLDLDKEDTTVTNEAGFIAYECMNPDEFVDFIRIKKGEPIMNYFLEQTTPFYLRS